ncbi:MAG TPA: hypothetical protein VIF64_09135 [Pyrinomonadaceae bacterium]|jgi:hypothetical protein
MDAPARAPIARSAGIQVPQLTQRTNFLSGFEVAPPNASRELAGDSPIVLATPKILFKTWM